MKMTRIIFSKGDMRAAALRFTLGWERICVYRFTRDDHGKQIRKRIPVAVATQELSQWMDTINLTIRCYELPGGQRKAHPITLRDGLEKINTYLDLSAFTPFPARRAVTKPSNNYKSDTAPPEPPQPQPPPLDEPEDSPLDGLYKRRPWHGHLTMAEVTEIHERLEAEEEAD